MQSSKKAIRTAPLGPVGMNQGIDHRFKQGGKGNALITGDRRTSLEEQLAERVGFEPTVRLLGAQTISSRPRYDHFGTSPQEWHISFV